MKILKVENNTIGLKIEEVKNHIKY